MKTSSRQLTWIYTVFKRGYRYFIRLLLRARNRKNNTLPYCCKSRLLPQGSRSVLYTYPYYIFPCFKWRQTLYHVAVKAGFYCKAVEVCYIPIPCFKLIRPESTQNHAVILGHFMLSDARNTSRGPTYRPPNVTGCRKIPHARGGNRTWAAGSKGKHSTRSL